MSFFDLRRRMPDGGSAASMEPPPFTLRSVGADLRWHYKLYRIDRLSLPVIAAFLALRVLHLAQYNRGWRRGISDA
jgi:hypothetical protein